MNRYIVIFYYKGFPTIDGPLIIEAEDKQWAEQELLLRLNTGEGIPGNWDRYDFPILVT